MPKSDKPRKKFRPRLRDQNPVGHIMVRAKLGMGAILGPEHTVRVAATIQELQGHIDLLEALVDEYERMANEDDAPEVS